MGTSNTTQKNQVDSPLKITEVFSSEGKIRVHLIDPTNK